MCEALEELMKDELDARESIGIKAGIAKGVQVLISDYLEEGFSKQKILLKLEKGFQLTEEQAMEYLHKFSK